MTDTTINNFPTEAPIDQIAVALVKFQKTIPQVVKDATADTGKYSYDYASLDKITPIIFTALTAQGIAYVAAPDLDENGNFGLRAALVHTSGQKIGGFYPLGNPGAPAQAIGSAITYARRYALLSLTGVAPAGLDDDGAAGQEAAGDNAPAKAVGTTKPKEDIATLRAQMGQIIESDKNTLTGEDANSVMQEVAPGKTPGQWTLTDLKKGRDQLIEKAKANLA